MDQICASLNILVRNRLLTPYLCSCFKFIHHLLRSTSIHLPSEVLSAINMNRFETVGQA